MALIHEVRLILSMALSIASCLQCGAFFLQHPEPFDRADLSPRITKIRGSVYLVEDLNFWKTNSVFYASQEGIVFFDATYSVDSAARVLWKAASLSEAAYIGLVLTGSELNRSGGIAAFELEKVPIYMHENTARDLKVRWAGMQDQMAASFGSWRRGNYAGPDGVFDNHLDILGGRVRVLFPGPAHSPGNLIVYFPRERVIYGGDLLSDPMYFYGNAAWAGYRNVWPLLGMLPADTYVSGHGDPLRGASFPDAVRRLAEERGRSLPPPVTTK